MSQDKVSSATYSRRVKSEVAIFGTEKPLHGHGPSFHHYTQVVVRPALEASFGGYHLHEIYARSIAHAVVRTGVDRVFSLGCGDGTQEREILRAAIRLGLPTFSIIGLELAPSVVKRANDASKNEGLADRMSAIVHDLNSGLPGNALS